MNLTQLKLFAEIASELSFVKVAKQNHISQPAVSVHIKKLEDALGQKLLTRNTQGTQLTPEGLLILEDVKSILQLCDNLKIRSNYSQGVLEGNIRVAAIHSVGMYEIGDFLASFMKAYPKVKIHLEFRHSEEIYDLLYSEKIDVGVVAYPEKRTRIKSIPYTNDELVLITPLSHRFAHKKQLSIKQLEGEAFIAFDESIPTRVAIDKVMAKYNVAVDIRMTNNNVFTLKKAVEAGVGLALVPSASVVEELRRGTLKSIKLSDVSMTRPLSLVHLSKMKPNTPTQTFIEQLLSFNH